MIEHAASQVAALVIFGSTEFPNGFITECDRLMRFYRRFRPAIVAFHPNC